MVAARLIRSGSRNGSQSAAAAPVTATRAAATAAAFAAARADTIGRGCVATAATRRRRLG